MVDGEEGELQLAVPPLGVTVDESGNGLAGWQAEQRLAPEPHESSGVPVEPDGLGEAQSARPVGEDLRVERRRDPVVAFEGHPFPRVQVRPEGERGGSGGRCGDARSGPRLLVGGVQAEHGGKFL